MSSEPVGHLFAAEDGDALGQPVCERDAAGRDAEQDGVEPGLGDVLDDLVRDPVDHAGDVGRGEEGRALGRHWEHRRRWRRSCTPDFLVRLTGRTVKGRRLAEPTLAARRCGAGLGRAAARARRVAPRRGQVQVTDAVGVRAADHHRDPLARLGPVGARASAATPTEAAGSATIRISFQSARWAAPMASSVTSTTSATRRCDDREDQLAHLPGRERVGGHGARRRVDRLPGWQAPRSAWEHRPARRR